MGKLTTTVTSTLKNVKVEFTDTNLKQNIPITFEVLGGQFDPGKTHMTREVFNDLVDGLVKFRDHINENY